MTNTEQYFIEIYRKADNHVERRMGPESYRRAERIQRGASINLNHDDYGVRIVGEKEGA